MKVDSYIALCVAQMALDGNSAATIDFFRRVAPRLIPNGHINGVSASELTFMTPQGAGKHLTNLTNKGYLTRKNHRRWEISDRVVKSPALIPFTRYVYSDN